MERGQRMDVQEKYAIRFFVLAVLAATLSVGLARQDARAQAPAKQDENPFPEDGPAPQSPASAAKPSTDSARDPAQPPKKESSNPFPGEDANVPILPVDPVTPSAPRPQASSSADDEAAGGHHDPDGDPIRSPDGRAGQTDDGFTSSRSGLDRLPAEDDSDAQPGKSVKNKTREQRIQEDVDVGSFYLDKKNWKAAQMRFQSAFVLDPENPDAVWGLAEAERHLNLFEESIGHYKLFLSYDPEGKHGKEARKLLEQLELSQRAPGENGPAAPK